MRILIIPSWYPTPRSPVTGIFVREQANALGQLHDVRVLYVDVLPRGTRRKSRRRVTRHRSYVEEIVEVPNLPGLWQFAYLWSLFCALRRLRRTFRPDVIHCHVAVPAGWGVAMLRTLFKLPVVLTEHSGEFVSWTRRFGLRWMARRAFQRVDTIITVGEVQKRLLKETFPHAAPIRVVSNMVDTARFVPAPFPPTDEEYRLLFIGLLDTKDKGLHHLLDALAQVEEKHGIPLHLTVVGDGLLRPDYAIQAARLGLGDNVTFVGIQPNSEVARLLRESHTLVLPSLYESQSVVVIESLASGRPVIATRCGGPEFLINDENGLVVEPGQAAPLAEAIANLLTHLDRYDPHAIAADAAKRYGQDTLVATLTEIYQALQHSHRY
ncbi:MAG TPA: glycosyltransferase [Chloroflexia bacterium]|nr:glycosyltransferase [Chloroflexia bacterium]